MKTILAFETSTARGSLAVRRDGRTIFEETFVSERAHNALLFGPLEAALILAPKPDLIVVGTGPGSYTGVRVSIAAALGVGLAKEVPVMGWNSLSSLQGAPRSYAVLGDARRGQWQFSEIHEGKFHAAPQVMNEQEAQQRCAEYPGLIFTLDRSAPSWSRAYTTVPDAALLAAFVDTLTETEIDQLTAIPVEPIYLSEPFITVPRQNS